MNKQNFIDNLMCDVKVTGSHKYYYLNDILIKSVGPTSVTLFPNNEKRVTGFFTTFKDANGNYKRKYFTGLGGIYGSEQITKAEYEQIFGVDIHD